MPANTRMRTRQPKASPGLVIRRSRIHAAGCYTRSSIKKGTFVVEYIGRRITVKEADALYDNCPRTYLFGLSDGKHVIDGDGVAAFINHSCDPNCEADEINGHIWIIAIRDIHAGEELTYDYNLYDGDKDDQAPCSCGAPNCRGSMYSPEELAQRARAAQRAVTKGTPSPRVTRSRKAKRSR
jgi:SET domain-containing protein